MKRVIGLALLLVGCKPFDKPDKRSSVALPSPSSTPLSKTPPEEPPPFDCAETPDAPLVRQLDVPRGYHDLVFDTEGNIIGSDGSSLIRSDGTTFEVIAPALGVLHGIEFLLDGDLVAASFETNALLRISLDGAVTTLATDLPAYSLAISPNGDIYTAYEGSYRIDPESGEREPSGLDDQGFSLRSIAFASDGRLYGATTSPDCYGIVFAYDFDADGTPLPDPERVWSPWDTPNESAWICFPDAVAVDVCGNVYVTDYVARTLYRITPEGELAPYLVFEGTDYGHGLTWGSGLGPWRADALYLPQPYGDNRVLEAIVGVPGAPAPNAR
ncbi:MAG: hypothetical protein ABMA64_05520 [Myxococcota bacterium]